MTHRLLLGCFITAVTVASAAAQPSTAAEYIEAGKHAFESGRYGEALGLYEKAFALESTAENALRTVVAAGYADDLASASKRLDIWMMKKRDDAKRLGDRDASWNLVDSVTKSLLHAGTEKDKRIADLERALEAAKRRETTIKTDYEKQLRDLRLDFQQRLDKTGGGPLIDRR
jgi:hypothetical protein